MGLKYLSGVPFLHLEAGHVEDFFPLMSVWSFNRQIIGNMTGMSDSDIGHLFGNGSKPTMKVVYDLVGTDVAKNMGNLGFLKNKGTYGPYSTGMYYTSQGWELQDANGVPILGGAAVGSTGIYYPNEGDFATSQYLVMGVVDNYNHISFGVLRGSYADVFGMYPSNSQPVFQQDNTVSIESGHTASEIYSLFEDGDWSDTPDPPAPPTSEGGYDLSNRFSPVIGGNTVGVYPLLQSEVIDLGHNLWTTQLVTAIGQGVGVLTDPADMLISLKWFYGMKTDVANVASDCYVVLGNVPMDGTHSETAITTKPLAKEFATHDCGTITVPEYFQNYLDYATKFDLFIPFHGFESLNASDVVGGTISLKYNVNMLTGDGVAYVTVNNPRSSNLVVMEFQCAGIGVDIPFNAVQMGNVATRAATTIAGAALVGASMATGGVGLLAAAGAAANVLNDTPKVVRSDRIGVGVGYVGSMTPRLLITRPVKATPAGIASVIGNKSCEVAKLSTKSGFVKADAVKPETINYGCKYMDDIINLVLNGVYM